MTLPNALTTIEEEAFSGLKTVQVIPGEAVNTIGSQAFNGMTGLKMVVISNSQTEIAANAFDSAQVILICTEGSMAQQYADAHGMKWQEK